MTLGTTRAQLPLAQMSTLDQTIERTITPDRERLLIAHPKGEV